MSEKKNYCPTHHFYYKGDVCPLCEKERIDRMVEIYGPKEEKKAEESKTPTREINEEDLAKLIAKFNVR